MKKSSRQLKRKRINVVKGEDRISSLPDDLIHIIFSNLDMRQVVQSSILSESWRNTWKSTPSLKFDFRVWKPDLSENERVIGFLKFVNKFLRDGSERISWDLHLQEFHLCMNHKFSSIPLVFISSLVKGLMDFALSRNVKRFSLYLDDVGDLLELPNELFTSCITHLKVSCIVMELPSCVNIAAKIKHMHLVDVHFPDGNEDEEFILSCPVLENLMLDDCWIAHLKILSLSMPRLKILTLSDLNTTENCVVKICSPILEKLTVLACFTVDHLNVHYYMENPSSLLSASIYVYPRTKDLQHLCAEFFVEVLKMVSNVQVLKVSGNLIQAFPYVLDLLPRLPEAFPNVRDVLLVDRCESWSMNSFLCFLDKFPQAETFVWYRYPTGRILPKSRRYWEIKLPPSPRIFECLKRFRMRNSLCTETEQKCLKFLFERAEVLEEVIITKGDKIGKKLRAFKKNLCSLPRASTNVMIRTATERRQHINLLAS